MGGAVSVGQRLDPQALVDADLKAVVAGSSVIKISDNKYEVELGSSPTANLSEFDGGEIIQGIVDGVPGELIVATSGTRPEGSFRIGGVKQFVYLDINKASPDILKGDFCFVADFLIENLNATAASLCFTNKGIIANLGFDSPKGVGFYEGAAWGATKPLKPLPSPENTWMNLVAIRKKDSLFVSINGVELATLPFAPAAWNFSGIGFRPHRGIIQIKNMYLKMPPVCKNQAALYESKIADLEAKLSTSEAKVRKYERIIALNRIEESMREEIDFVKNESAVKPDGVAVIQAIARVLHEYPELRINIESHTNCKPEAGCANGECHLMALSQDRVESVKKLLIDNEKCQNEFICKGWGCQHPTIGAMKKVRIFPEDQEH